jgi:predicted Rossmann fold nucleotide-binding protein DprA/Smf involved in DNA uptake
MNASEGMSQSSGPQRIARDAGDYPEILRSRLGDKNAPAELILLGDQGLLRLRKTGLFCSARTPGDAILRAHDAARRMRDEGVTVISGFHSPIERECLRILLRGKQPVIICPARAIDTMRIPKEVREAFNTGRVLLLSPFRGQPERITKESALRRNEVVAALADEAYIAHVERGGGTARIAQMLDAWSVPNADIKPPFAVQAAAGASGSARSTAR